MLVLVLIGLAWGLGPGASDRAGAARYTVAQCGWKVGNEGQWSDTSSGRFNSSSWCGVPEKSDPWDGIHVTSGTRVSTKLVRGTDLARWRWQAPTGTGIVSVSGNRWHVLRDNFRHRLGSIAPSGGFTPFSDFTSTDTVRRHFSKHFSPYAKAFESRLLCARPQGSNCDVKGTSLAGVRALTFTVDDPSRPTVDVKGPFGEAEWVRGGQEITLASRDSGSGVQVQEFQVGRSVVIRAEAACARKLIAGQWRATRMKPCQDRVEAARNLATDRFADGPQTVRACAQDFASNRTCTADLTLHMDNTAPAPPRSLEVIGGEQWRSNNGFSLAWELPDQGRAAPVTAARYALTGPDGFTLGPVDSDSVDSLSDIELPAPGEYRLEVWLVDEAGNEDRSASARANLRLDDVPPSAHLLRPGADRPDLIRAPVSDLHSGPEGGLIQVRRRGSEVWQDLSTSFSTERSWLTADFDSELRLPGTWEVRATAIDRAGNQKATTRLQDGSSLLLQAPAKIETDLQASLSNGRRRGRDLRVRLGRRAVLTGRLVTGRGRGIPSAEVRVIQAFNGPGRRDPAIRTVNTDRSGRFRVGLRQGVSRQVTVLYTGSDRFGRSSFGPLRLRVSAGLSFKARPVTLSTGGRVRFSGRVTPGRAARAAKGSVVQVQYREAASGRWRPVLVTRVGSRGLYRSSYRFRYVTGTARIRLRAQLFSTRGFPWATTVSRPVSVLVRG
jgi:hypothetical protein